MASFGVIEIGSNGLRYEVARIDNGLEEVEYRSTERSNLIGLLDERNGSVSPRFKDTVVTKIDYWLNDARKRNVDKLVVVTTEVGRAIERIDQGYWHRLGLIVNTLTAASEARFSYLAAKRMIDSVGLPSALIDVGNGSMSISRIEGNEKSEFFAISVGAELLSQMFVKNKGRPNIFPDLLKREFPSFPADSVHNVVVMGGLATKVAWHVLRESQTSRYNAKLLSGRTVARIDLQRSYTLLWEIVTKRGAAFAIDYVDPLEDDSWKLLHIMTGLRFFDALLGFVSAQCMFVCTDSVRHGVIRFLGGDNNGTGHNLSAVW